MQKGILLLAAGDARYGLLAYQAAISIKCNDGTMPVALAYTAPALAELSPAERSIFDSAVEVGACLSGEDYIGLKTALNHFTPFEQTLFLDADTLWLPRRPIRELFERHRNVPFTAQCYTYWNVLKGRQGVSPYTFWAEPAEIVRHYGIKNAKLPQLSTTFLLFQKGERTERLFESVREKYLKDDDDKNTPLKSRFGNGKPDEYFFNIACAEMNILPPRIPFKPVYFHFVEQDRSLKYIYEHFHALTTGGNHVPTSVARIYDNLLTQYTKQAGVTPRFFHLDKKEWLRERTLF